MQCINYFTLQIPYHCHQHEDPHDVGCRPERVVVAEENSGGKIKFQSKSHALDKNLAENVFIPDEIGCLQKNICTLTIIFRWTVQWRRSSSSPRPSPIPQTRILWWTTRRWRNFSSFSPAATWSRVWGRVKELNRSLEQ